MLQYLAFNMFILMSQITIYINSNFQMADEQTSKSFSRSRINYARILHQDYDRICRTRTKCGGRVPVKSNNKDAGIHRVISASFVW